MPGGRGRPRQREGEREGERDKEKGTREIQTSWPLTRAFNMERRTDTYAR